MVSNASFNGTNLIKSGATNVAALANADGTSVLTVAAQDLSLGVANVTLTATASISTQTLAAAAITTVAASITKTGTTVPSRAAAARPA